MGPSGELKGRTFFGLAECQQRHGVVVASQGIRKHKGFVWRSGDRPSPCTPPTHTSASALATPRSTRPLSPVHVPVRGFCGEVVSGALLPSGAGLGSFRYGGEAGLRLLKNGCFGLSCPAAVAMAASRTLAGEEEARRNTRAPAGRAAAAMQHHHRAAIVAIAVDMRQSHVHLHVMW